MGDFSLKILPPLAAARAASTAQSSQLKYTSVLLPPEGQPPILTNEPDAP
jgi:hypothetical protein